MDTKEKEESSDDDVKSEASVPSSDVVGLAKKAPAVNFADLAQDLQPASKEA